jgi:hypothetical protein
MADEKNTSRFAGYNVGRQKFLSASFKDSKMNGFKVVDRRDVIDGISAMSPRIRKKYVEGNLDMQTFERLTLTVDKTMVSPGDTVTFSVTADEGIVLDHAAALYQGEPFVSMSQSGANPFQGSLTIPKTFSGVKKFAAIGLSGEDLYGSKQTVSIIVKPNLTNLSSIYAEPKAVISCSEGFKQQLTITGVLSDGTEYDITRSELGTTYSVGDSSVITVTKDGFLKALKTGKTVITISNGKVSKLLYVKVNPPP